MIGKLKRLIIKRDRTPEVYSTKYNKEKLITLRYKVQT